MLATRVSRIDERGLSSLEVTMILPLIALLMVMAIGIGEALIVRQHSVMAARYAATMHSLNQSAPSPAQVSAAASAGRETWMASPVISGASFNQSGLIGGLSVIVNSAISAFIDRAGRLGDITYRLGSQPSRGIFARYFTLKLAEGYHRLPSGTWTCLNGGGIMAGLTGQVKIPGMTIPGSLPCCRSYKPPSN